MNLRVPSPRFNSVVSICQEGTQQVIHTYFVFFFPTVLTEIQLCCLDLSGRNSGLCLFSFQQSICKYLTEIQLLPVVSNCEGKPGLRPRTFIFVLFFSTVIIYEYPTEIQLLSVVSNCEGKFRLRLWPQTLLLLHEIDISQPPINGVFSSILTCSNVKSNGAS